MDTQQNSRIIPFALRWNGWAVGAVVLAVLIVAPMLAVLWIALHPTENIWPHLLATVLPRYFGTTLVLMTGVAVLAGAAGTGAAWLITMYRFPGRDMLAYALLFPLAIPAYVGAFALVDFLDYSGLVQTFLRATFGWTSARDYWFPQIRTNWGAIVVLASAQYPYVYLLTRAALREQSGGMYEVARALGLNGWGVFWRLGLPLARPAIAAGVALAMMETVADFGTVQYFGVQTLTTGIFTTWLDGGNPGGAAQIAGVILVLILTLVAIERFSRRNARFHRPSRAPRPIAPVRLTGGQAAMAWVLCVIPFAVGFLLPVGVMGLHAVKRPEVWLEPGLLAAAVNTAVVGGIAAVLTVAAALFLVYAVRMAGRGTARLVLPVTTLGYAAPGAVLAVGILIPLAALDHKLADGWLALTGQEPGLLLTGTSAAIVLAYVVRFFGMAQSAADTAFGRIPPSLPMAARSLGQTNGGTLRRVYLPMMRGSVAAALLVVFVECVKELPATLLLRPFNFNTLSTRVYELASLEKLEEASPAALGVVAMGLLAVALLAHNSRDR
ncbi:ABC transporter permease [Fuscibacter oryzae]|uniref:Iron ABC transporter permease n=1 Tax=Fuscibacter oryzae TaxID=2803939 RepID=A0A8J7SUZ8_9RHOB|nr:iron ABC transporter permease [Fuscibacter oryzae]MBL4927279.1 iron ABC transporter permease [Fuscibacter oryzae]